jgi:hypothetical protein
MLKQLIRTQILSKMLKTAIVTLRLLKEKGEEEEEEDGRKMRHVCYKT